MTQIEKDMPPECLSILKAWEKWNEDLNYGLDKFKNYLPQKIDEEIYYGPTKNGKRHGWGILYGLSNEGICKDAGYFLF